MGKPLKMGEKLKALTTGASHGIVKLIAENELFDITPGLKMRANNWTLAATFMKISSSKNPLIRVEFPQMKEYISSKHEDAARTLEECRRTLSYLRRVIKEAEGINSNSNFVGMARAARTLKWLFATLTQLGRTYSLAGRETSVASAVIDYYEAVKVSQSIEWTNYLETGRTGRLDNEWVKLCIDQLMGRIVNQAELSPSDPKRTFTPSQRSGIFMQSDAKCKSCGVAISETNFHADHIKAHSKGGRTDTVNGQALCSRCNTRKGNAD